MKQSDRPLEATIVTEDVTVDTPFRPKVQKAATDPVAVAGSLGITLQVRQQISSIHTLEVHTGLGEKRREEPMVFYGSGVVCC